MRDLSLNQRFGYVFGAVYLLVGAVGFAVTTDVAFAESEGDTLLWFELNPLHNIVHLAIGALLFGGAMAGMAPSRAVNAVVGVTYLAVGIVGFFIVDETFNILALNMADNWLHIGTGALALLVAMSEMRAGRRAPALDRDVSRV